MRPGGNLIAGGHGHHYSSLAGSKLPVAGRVRTELEGLVGCFLNTLVLRADLDGNPDFAGLLERHLTDEEEIIVPVILKTGFTG